MSSGRYLLFGELIHIYKVSIGVENFTKEVTIGKVGFKVIHSLNSKLIRKKTLTRDSYSPFLIQSKTCSVAIDALLFEII